MRSKIKHITGDGSYESKHGTMYNFEVTMEDGYVGQISHSKYKSVEELPYKIGEEKDYEQTDFKGYPKIKWIEASPTNTSFTPKVNGETQSQIVRMNALTNANASWANGINIEKKETLVDLARYYEQYILNG